MYCRYYGLKEPPFNVTSDPAFFFSSKQHHEALAHLLYGVNMRKGIIVLTGQIGTGKTTICRFFLSQLGKNVKTAFILNPAFSEMELLKAILNDFGITAKDTTKLGMILALNNFLLRESAAGHNLVLIIDEAQNLKPNLLEQVRLLSNLETEKDKLLQVILVGQPELNTRLNLYDLRQLRQRVMVRYQITPLDNDEIKDYINYRLKIAQIQRSASQRIEFSDSAIGLISQFSGGIPRLINLICDRSLLAGFVSQAYRIDEVIIKRCLDELDSYAIGKTV